MSTDQFIGPAEALTNDFSQVVHERAEHSLAALRERKTYYDSCPAVPLQVSAPQVHEQMRRLMVTLPAAASGMHLPPTSFELWESGELVHQYSVQAAEEDTDPPASYRVDYVRPENAGTDSAGRVTVYAESWSGRVEFTLPPYEPEKEMTLEDLELEILRRDLDRPIPGVEPFLHALVAGNEARAQRR